MRPTPRLLWWLLAWTGLGLLLALNQWLPAGCSLPEWQPQLTQLWRVTTTAALNGSGMHMAQARTRPP